MWRPRTYKSRGFFNQPNLLLLQYLRFFVAGGNNFRITRLFWIFHQATIQLDEFLNAAIALMYRGAQLLNLIVLGLYLFVQVGNLSWQVCDYATSAGVALHLLKVVEVTVMYKLLKYRRCILCDGHDRCLEMGCGWERVCLVARGTCEATVCDALGASTKVQTGQEKPDASIATVTSMKIDET